ncbi:nucleotidyltransferase [Tuanshanicoccus lijuaniae]|uniref:nucleotidyltransferase family protein n=1 Tax=Aerococcaceae bacterium zg-1292 TaxID=2774330 RepID=UPI001938EA74|nr:nucleotidyltransferase [Aerococcaceae bacterium zg-1292]MBS4456999.1 hypothetical protein [Aerococcaceae bacterium zg-A91]MBS4458736.1 hypothetical protein [Aerococcaceae bacterium zg-BR33]QQA37516.1 nucleotidyltransferase [Aerococcaceae bacterium zg-1292]
MREPILVVMAAGMGSRYGSLKQMDALGPGGETILDYSIRDACEAGFRRVIFIIKEEFKIAFDKKVGQKARERMSVDYVVQSLNQLPVAVQLPKERQKPLGTAHAVWCAKDKIDAPFAVINADDYYGLHAYQQIYDFLANLNQPNHYAMVGYALGQTLSPNGTVSRGLCTLGDNHELLAIKELTQIEAHELGVRYRDDDSQWCEVALDRIVSMNLWGFPVAFLDVLETTLSEMLQSMTQEALRNEECYLPSVVEQQISNGAATVTVLETDARWFGVTYKEDKAFVKAQLEQIERKG